MVDDGESVSAGCRVLLVFVDGLGLARAGAPSPWRDHPSPSLDALIRGTLDAGDGYACDHQLLRPVDACLGVEGLHRALSWDLCRDLSAAVWDPPVERLSPRQAAADLVALSARHRLTVYETFLPDLVGHGRSALPPAEVVARLDGLVGGLVEELEEDTTLVLTSDHGNFEEPAHRRHTRNPVPLLVVGPGARSFADVTSLVGVAPAILRTLGVDSGVAAE